MAFIERPLSEQECFSALSRTESSMSGSSEPAGLLHGDGSEMWSSSTGDIHSLRESVFSAAGFVRAAGDTIPANHGNEVGSLSIDTTITKKEILKQNQLRRYIDQLQAKKSQTEEEVEKQTESLMACRENLKSLYNQYTLLEQNISGFENEIEQLERGEAAGGGGEMKGGSVASCGLVRAQMGRLRREIEREEETEKDFAEKLQVAQLQLSTATMAYAEHEEVDKQLKENERQTQTTKNLQALQRLQTQTRMRVNAYRSKTAQEKSKANSIRLQQSQVKEVLEKAQHSQKEGRAFLQKTLHQQRTRDAEERKKEREEMERRTQAVLSLKRNTENSEGTIKALHMLKEEHMIKERAREAEQRKQAMLDGYNPDEVVLREKREREFTDKKTEFDSNQRQKHLEIVSKLLEEDKLKKKTEKIAAKAHWQGRWPLDGAQQPEMKSSHSQRRRTRQRLRINDNKAAVHGCSEEVSESVHEEDVPDIAESEKVVKGLDCDEGLDRPEIDGLWNKTGTAIQQMMLEKDEEEEERKGDGCEVRGRREKGRSKLEEKMLTSVMDNLKGSIVRRQIAAGKEFKGCPFTSKPKVAEFTDFSPGDILKLKLTLTNVTYTVNYCKLVGMSSHLEDFISVNFNPPGAMSAGLTCHMTITFEPKLNEDLKGEIKLLSQTGPFSIPVRCTTRKCIISVTQRDGGVTRDVKLKKMGLDFGKVCVGETARKCLTLHNDGAIATNFTVTPSEEGEMALVMDGSTVEGGVADSAHTLTSVESVMSVMSEVRGDWGALVKVKDTDRPVSRSTSELPQLKDSPTEEKTGTKPVELDTQDVPDDQKQTIIDSGLTEEDKELNGGSEVGRKELKSSSIGCKEEEDFQPAITVGKIKAGCLEGYSSCSIEFLFSPLTPTITSQLFTIHCSQPGVPPITICARGQGTDLPVFVKRDTIDLQICTIDRLYQDSIEVHNRGPTALRVSFILPPEVAPHLEILPPHGLVQGASSFSAQLKFLPLTGIFTDCKKILKNDQLSIPAEIRVVDQVLPVPYSIQARITRSDFKFSTTDIDFGTCTIHESVVSTIEITNTSILPQEFGFVHLPECVDVQPNDGFGTLLPHETISVDVIFSASKPRDYCFELSCLTEMNRTFKIACRGKGILPALKLLGNTVNFAATPLNSVATARISVTNPKLSRLSSPVIRGAILPQGSKMFEFLVPNGVPIEISPRVGTIGLDETVSIEFSYTPTLSKTAIAEEAINLATLAAHRRAAELAAQQKRTTDSTPTLEKKKNSSRAVSRNKTGKGGGASGSSGGESVTSSRKNEVDGKSGSARSDTASRSGMESRQSTGVNSDNGNPPLAGGEEVKVDAPVEGSEMWQKATENLLDKFQNWTDQFSIACFVSSEVPRSELDTVPYRPEDTLYVEFSVPIVKPALQIVSNCGKNILDFGAVATGDTLSKKLTVKNTSDHSIKLSSSPLSLHGPFELRNALRSLSPSATHSLTLSFTSQHSGKYHESMMLFYSESCGMELRLIGEAVEPHVVLEPDTDRMECGHTYAGDVCTRTFKLRNTCSLAVKYQIRQQRKWTEKEEIFRAANYSGKPVFDCIPFRGRIEPDGTAKLEVTFSPDHQSLHFSDCLYIDINNSLTYSIELSGQAWSNTMYILGGDNHIRGCEQKGVEFESMAAKMPILGEGEAEQSSLPVKPVLILFQSRTDNVTSGDIDSSEKEGEDDDRDDGITRELEIGCIATPLVKKNGGDYTVEAISSANPHAKCFSFDPVKSSVEGGSTKILTITFHPPKTGVKASIIEADTNIILKGDTTQVYRLLLRAIMSE